MLVACNSCGLKIESRYKHPSCNECLARRRLRYSANRDKHKARRKAWRKTLTSKDRHVMAATMRKYCKANAESVAATHRKYIESPRGRMARIAANSNRRAERFGVPGVLALTDIQEMYRKHYDMYPTLTCTYCYKTIVDDSDHHVDHIYPLSRGGRNVTDNLTVACVACNEAKHNQDPYDFRVWVLGQIRQGAW